MIIDCRKSSDSPKWYIFRRIHYSLNRQAELKRLIAWAEQKRLKGPLRLYKLRLQDEQIRYSRYTITSPTAATLAYFIHCLTKPLRPIPHYPHKGSAAFYRSRRLDRCKNRHIVYDNN